jgi:hypothetical protein
MLTGNHVSSGARSGAGNQGRLRRRVGAGGGARSLQPSPALGVGFPHSRVGDGPHGGGGQVGDAGERAG